MMPTYRRDVDIATLRIEHSGNPETSRCSCCGHFTATVWGEVWSERTIVAVYRVQWTESHLKRDGAFLDLVFGSWGDGTSRADRTVVRLEHRSADDGPSVMVRDAALTNELQAVAARALARADIIGTWRAPQIFDIYDAIITQDENLEALLVSEPDAGRTD